MGEPLKPCSFCGSEGVATMWISGGRRVRCHDCGGAGRALIIVACAVLAGCGGSQTNGKTTPHKNDPWLENFDRQIAEICISSRNTELLSAHADRVNADTFAKLGDLQDYKESLKDASDAEAAAFKMKSDRICKPYVNGPKP